MLDWLYDGGKAFSPVYRAAYVMWKINAIHPFNGGKGRVARAVAYLVVVSEIAPVFAGESLPAKLKARKPELDGLQAADKGDLSKLEQLVLECFESQFDDLARKALRSNRLVFVRCRTEKIYSRDVFYRAVKLETARGRVDD